MICLDNELSVPLTQKETTTDEMAFIQSLTALMQQGKFILNSR
jgi:hypothetical protein